MGEAETSFDLEVRGQPSTDPAAPYSVGLVLSGSMAVDLPGGGSLPGLARASSSTRRASSARC